MKIPKPKLSNCAESIVIDGKYPSISYIPTDKSEYEQLMMEIIDRDRNTLPSFEEVLKHFDNKLSDVLILRESVVLIMIVTIDGTKFKLSLDIFSGTIWDGASVPTPFSIGKRSKLNRYVAIASLIHDILYANNKRIGMSRETCDDIFDQVMKFYGLSKFNRMRYMVWLRLFGNIAFIRSQKYKKSITENCYRYDFCELK